ncbi:MAG TPA: sensor histidine kinase [Blastocatellia bacterium]|nr:sensor histidine kinase [Blastocatellia bacterium]
MSGKSVALALMALLFTAVLLPGVAEGRKHILLVFDEDKDFPGLARLNQSLRGAFLSELDGNVEFYSESLNLSQFRDERHDGVLRDYYRRKYAGTRLDLIVAVMGPSLEFLLRHGAALFPGIPIVFCGVDPSNLEGKTLSANITGVLVNRAFGPTLDIALRLQPGTRSVFVVGGTSSFDRQLQAIARRDFEPFERRAAIIYLTALPMEDLLLRLSHLPAHSVVIYLTLFADGKGRPFVPHDALKLITRAANAPVYVSVDQYLGQGAVGGHVYSLETHGHDTAEIGLRILRGESPANIPIIEKSAYRDIFDWRQLQRWGLDENLLPPGSVIEFRQPTAWDRYRWYIVAALAIIAFQGAIIGDLLLHRARRRRAEALQQELAHVSRMSTMGELAASLAHELNQPLTAILSNAQAAQRFIATNSASLDEVKEILADIVKDDSRAGAVIRQMRALVKKEALEFALFDLTSTIREVVVLARTDAILHNIHVLLDIDPGMPLVRGDRVQLQQVLLNLLLNAFDAMKDCQANKREITVRAEHGGGRMVEITVADHGTGLPGHKLEKIFQPFYTTKPNGLGMGLSISRSIIEAHGGRLWAENNADCGATFFFTVPIANEAENQEYFASNRKKVASVK